jgi:peptide/nickel transport system permease protein
MTTIELTPVAVPGPPVVRTRRMRAGEVFRLLLRRPTFVIGAVVVLFWVFDAVFWPLLVPFNPQASNLIAVLHRPDSQYLLGTDNLGRDVLSRVLAGVPTVLTIAPLGTLIGLTAGTIFGLVGGYFGGIVDDVIGRLADALLAFPLIILAMLALSMLGSSEINVILVIGVVFSPLIYRTVRSVVLVERDKEYVAAAKMRGDSTAYILFAEILPNISGPLTVEATVRLSYAIFTSATLSFLQLGVGVPSPDWGLTIAIEYEFLAAAWWPTIFPAIALATLVVGAILVADSVDRVLAS